jgi:hypothetical protein
MVFNALSIWSLHPINRGFCRRRKKLPQQEIDFAAHAMRMWIANAERIEIYDESRATRHLDRACIRGMGTTFSTQSAQVTALCKA